MPQYRLNFHFRLIPFILIVLMQSSLIAQDGIYVYPAKKIITMDPRYPEAKVIAVRDGRVLSIGQTMADLDPWLRQYSHEVIDTFEDKIIVPGFVDPHIHPLLAALFLPHYFAAPDDWTFPYGTVKGVAGKAAFLERVKEGLTQENDFSDWLLIFGWAEAVHGMVTRDELDALGSTRPIAISSRSTHTMIMNTVALERLKITKEVAAKHPIQSEINYAEGRFIEKANFLMVVPRLAPIIFAPDRLQYGLSMFRDMAHSAGITTIAEPGSGIVSGGGDARQEQQILSGILDQPDTPFRTYLFPPGYINYRRLGSEEKMFEYMESLPDYSGNRIQFLPKKVKFLYDGSYVDQLGIYDPPGYIDGHKGVPIDPPDIFHKLLPEFWNRGYSIHVHVQGDGGARTVVETLAALQEQKPRFDHRFTLEHMGQVSQETLEKASKLGASISALIYPLHSMGDPFSEKVLGKDRMEMAFPYAEAVKMNMPFALHSDTPVAPPNPLRNAWIALNRQTTSGQVIGHRQALSVHDALRAITIEAAFMLELENEIGSLRPGKKADFTILEKDPYKVKKSEFADIPIWGTVFEGRLQPAKNDN